MYLAHRFLIRKTAPRHGNRTPLKNQIWSSRVSVAPPSAGISAPPTCSDPFVHRLNETPACRGPDPAKPHPADHEPQPSLLERLNHDHRVRFLTVWHELPPAHLREISFDFHGPGWDPHTITQLENTLTEFADVFSTSSTNFGSRCLLLFDILLPLASSRVASRPYRVTPIVADQTDAILDGYLVAGLIQPSTSP